MLESLIHLDGKKISAGLDEIRLFWIRHIEAVQLYLRKWFPGENSYVFTASAYLDYDDNEHLPFLLLGDKHILDDPLSRYAEEYSSLSDPKDIDVLSKLIITAAKDNLKILKNIHGDIFILPLRLLSPNIKNKYLYDIAEKMFLRLFRGVESVDDFFSKCNNIDEIEQYAHENIGSILLFSEEDDHSLSLKERFQAALAGAPFIVNERESDSYNFFMLVFGYLHQAINVIDSCIEFGCIPYIRNPVVYHYIMILLANMEPTDHICFLRYKMSVAYVVYQICEKEKLAKACMTEYIKKCREYDFCSKVYYQLDEHGIKAKNYFQFPIAEIIGSELEKFYNILSDRAE